jgi:DNA-binding CsgD family transcriptional regulator
MSRLGTLRTSDARAIWELVNECRALGDDCKIWREHCVVGLARMVDADLGMAGEMAGCHTLAPRDLGASFWWQLDFPGPDFLHPNLARFRADPGLSPAMLEYFRRKRDADGLCLTRCDFIDDRDWLRSADYQVIHESYGTDATLWCFRQIPGARPGECLGIVMIRARGRRDFTRRDRALVHEATATLTPMLGGTLARSDEPPPSALTPRGRQVLACLLQGDGDKQVAARLRLGTHTVNEYTKLIYRHFGVRSRTELLARWIRRGWSGRVAWAEAYETASGIVIPSGSGYRMSLDQDHQFKPAPTPQIRRRSPTSR